MTQNKIRFLCLTTLMVFLYMIVPEIVLSLEVVNNLSNFLFEVVQNSIHLLFICTNLVILWKYGNREIFRFRFKVSYIGYFFLFFILYVVWNIFVVMVFPRTVNQTGIVTSYENYDLLTNILVTFSSIVIAPISEELVFRGLVMEATSFLKKYYLDVIISGVLFSILHIVGNGWLLTDFITYLVPGLLLATYFRKTNCIYYPILFHGFWNAIPSLLLLFT